MRWVESHISHCSRVLRRCHPERSSCSGEFGCRSFKKHSPCTVCFLPCHVKKLACFYELKFFLVFCFLFGWSLLNISLQDSVLETETSGKIRFAELFWFVTYRRLWTLMVLTLTAFVLYSQSDYLYHSNRDSDWLIVTCFTRVQSMLTTLLFASEIKFVLKI